MSAMWSIKDASSKDTSTATKKKIERHESRRPSIRRTPFYLFIPDSIVIASDSHVVL